jgi:hypothetical protein
VLVSVITPLFQVHIPDFYHPDFRYTKTTAIKQPEEYRHYIMTVWDFDTVMTPVNPIKYSFYFIVTVNIRQIMG